MAAVRMAAVALPQKGGRACLESSHTGPAAKVVGRSIMDETFLGLRDAKDHSAHYVSHDLIGQGLPIRMKEETGHKPACHNVLADNLLDVLGVHAIVPDTLWIYGDIGAEPASSQTAGLRHLDSPARRLSIDGLLQQLVVLVISASLSAVLS